MRAGLHWAPVSNQHRRLSRTAVPKWGPLLRLDQRLPVPMPARLHWGHLRSASRSVCGVAWKAQQLANSNNYDVDLTLDMSSYSFDNTGNTISRQTLANNGHRRHHHHHQDNSVTTIGSLVHHPVSPCQNNGRCKPLTTIAASGDNSTHLLQYKCECLPGFEGKNCEINIDDCQDHQCQNKATCIDAINSYKCQCLDNSQTTGEYCEVLIAPPVAMAMVGSKQEPSTSNSLTAGTAFPVDRSAITAGPSALPVAPVTLAQQQQQQHQSILNSNINNSSGAGIVVPTAAANDANGTVREAESLSQSGDNTIIGQLMHQHLPLLQVFASALNETNNEQKTLTETLSRNTSHHSTTSKLADQDDGTGESVRQLAQIDLPISSNSDNRMKPQQQPPQLQQQYNLDLSNHLAADAAVSLRSAPSRGQQQQQLQQQQQQQQPQQHNNNNNNNDNIQPISASPHASTGDQIVGAAKLPATTATTEIGSQPAATVVAVETKAKLMPMKTNINVDQANERAAEQQQQQQDQYEQHHQHQQLQRACPLELRQQVEHGSCFMQNDNTPMYRCAAGYMGQRCEQAQSFMFKATNESILKFDQYLDNSNSDHYQANISFKFATDEQFGPLFYTGNDYQHITVELYLGHVRVSFNMNKQPATHTYSLKRCNDSNYHHVELIVNNQYVNFTLDGNNHSDDKSLTTNSSEHYSMSCPLGSFVSPSSSSSSYLMSDLGSSSSMGRSSASLSDLSLSLVREEEIEFEFGDHYYVGGIERSIYEDAWRMAHVQSSEWKFRGCMKEIFINGQSLSPALTVGPNTVKPGLACQQFEQIDPCKLATINRCQQPNSCVPIDKYLVKCQCRNGWSGEFCQEAPTCQRQRVRRYYEDGQGCRSTRRIKLSECVGSCGSQCCRASKYKKKQIKMRCPDGFYVKTIDIVKKCSCHANSNNSHTSTSSSLSNHSTCNASQSLIDLSNSSNHQFGSGRQQQHQSSHDITTSQRKNSTSQVSLLLDANNGNTTTTNLHQHGMLRMDDSVDYHHSRRHRPHRHQQHYDDEAHEEDDGDR